MTWPRVGTTLPKSAFQSALGSTMRESKAMLSTPVRTGGGDMADSLAATFRQQVRKVFAGQFTDPIFNGSVDHASIVIEEGFNAARSHVRILAHRLDTASYGRRPIIDAARRFLGREGTHLSILIEDVGPSGCLPDNPFLSEMLALCVEEGADVAVRSMPRSVVEAYDYNFMLVDDIGYRFEGDRREHVAVVAGGVAQSDGTEHLRGLYDDILWNHGVPLPPNFSGAMANLRSNC